MPQMMWMRTIRLSEAIRITELEEWNHYSPRFDHKETDM